MLVPDSTRPEGEQIKLLDFGIVKILQGAEPSPEDSQDGVTRQGAILGTPRYMAPEQWLCKTVDDKTDVYALGVMTFLALSGKLPFVAADGPALGMMHCYMKAPSLARVTSDVPPELVKLVAQMLEKSPAKRPAMLEVANTLEAFMPELAESPADASLPSAFVSAELPLEVCIEAEYEGEAADSGTADTMNANEGIEYHDLDLTQRLLPITQRATRPLHQISGERSSGLISIPSLPIAPRVTVPSPTIASELPVVPGPTVISKATVLTSVIHENTDSMLVASSDNFKIKKDHSSWVAMGFAAALIACAAYFMSGIQSANVVRMIELQAAAPQPPASPPMAPVSLMASTPPLLLVPLVEIKPEPKPASLFSETPTTKLKVKTHRPRLLPDSSCIENTDLNSEQQAAILQVLARSHTKLYPKERLVLIRQDDALQIQSAPKSMSARMRANLESELARSAEHFTTSEEAPAASPIDIRCPVAAAVE